MIFHSSAVLRFKLGAIACCLLTLSSLQLIPVASQEYQGYTDVSFTVTPQSLYSIPSHFSRFNCRAQGTKNGITEDLDVVFFRNDMALLNKYNLPSRHYYTNDDGFTTTGLLILPTILEDNHAVFRCQVFINNNLVDVVSPPASLIVAGGKPPAVSLTLKSTSFQSATVQWDSVLVPLDSPVLSYNARLYDSSGSFISSTELADNQQLNFTFTNLRPDTSYQTSIIAVNEYGNGNESSLFTIHTITSPQAPSPPSLNIVSLPSDGNIRLSWEAPQIDPETTATVSQYTVQYYPTNNPSDIHNSNATGLYKEINGLTMGQEYTFRVAPVNYGTGPLNYISQTYTINPYTGTATPVTPTSSTQTTSSQIASPSSSSSPTPTTGTSSATAVATSSSIASSSIASSPVASSPVASSPIASSSSVVTAPTTIHSSTISLASSSIQQTASSATSSGAFTTPTPSSMSIEQGTTTTTTATTPTVNSHTAPRTSQRVSLPVTSSSANLYTSSLTTPSSSVTYVGGLNRPGSVIVYATAAVASVVILAIVIISVVLLTFCVYTTRKKDDIDLTDGPKSWPEKPQKRWNSKESSIKCSSSLSGSVSHHSLSSDQDINGDKAIHNNQLYANVPTDSPGSNESHDLSSIQESEESEQIEVVIETYETYPATTEL